MPEEKALLAGLFDFGFRSIQSQRIVKLLYIIAMLGGGIGLVVEVVLETQADTAKGLLTLVFGLVAYFVWILLVRVGLEVVLAIHRMADNLDRATRGSN